MAALRSSSGSLARPIRWLGVALAAVVLTTVFAVARFPYDRLARTISDRSEALVGIRLQIADLGPSLWPASFGIIASDVRAVLPRGETLVIPSIRIRPSWSLGWLRATPALLLDVEGGGLGDIAGELTLGPSGGFDGGLEAVNLALLPLDQLVPGLAMEGEVNAVAELALDEQGDLLGTVTFRAAEGSLSAAGMPVALPFESFEGELEFGGEHFARVAKLALRGPMLDANADGTVGRAVQRGSEPLAMTLSLRPKGDALRPMLRQLGVTFTPAGTAELQITGTLSRPTFR